MALTDSLISYWKLDEASGDALDAHGANTLTDTNTVAAATGKINGGRDFEQSNSEYFTKADNADLSTGDIDFSFGCWINCESLINFPVIAHKGWGTGTQEWILYVRSDDANKLWFSVVADANTVKSAALSTATWYYVLVWHDSVNNVIGISLNGTEVTASYSSGITDGAGAFQMGAVSATALYFDGIIDEAGFWKRVITDAEIDSLYNAGAGLAYSSFGGGGGGVFGSYYYRQVAGMAGTP